MEIIRFGDRAVLVADDSDEYEYGGVVELATLILKGKEIFDPDEISKWHTDVQRVIHDILETALRRSAEKSSYSRQELLDEALIRLQGGM